MKINPLSKITNSELVNKHIKRTIQDDAFAAKALVAANVCKDVFAYGVRFKTTLNNKEIPEEKRPFVASMDLMSGVVTAILQIGAGFSLANPKFQNFIWDKFFKNCKFNDMFAAKKGFSQILALIGSTILAERILVPLFATPAAEKVQKTLFSNDNKQTIKSPNQNMNNSYGFVSIDQFEKYINH